MKFRLTKKDGLDYAKKSGDFNSIHLNSLVGYNSSFGSVGLLFSYSLWNSSFKPEMIGMTQISGLNSSNFNALNRVFCVGLSYEKVFGYK